MGKVSVEVAGDAVCSYFIMCKVNEVESFSWWKVHLLLLCLLSGNDSFSGSMGWSERRSLMW